MSNATVYFATNRKQIGPSEFDSSIVANDPKLVTYAIAKLSNVTLDDADSGHITSIQDIHMGDFSDAAKAGILSANKNILVFIHGASNPFDSAIRRAAFNRAWFANSGIAAANTTVIAFTWPSSDFKIFGAVDPVQGYQKDQTQAGKSGSHLNFFFQNLAKLHHDFVTAHPDGKMFLLVHSMGHYVLQAGVQTWFDTQAPNELSFDQVLLAAPDEVADSFIRPNGGRLSHLAKLGKKISVYSSRRDILMHLSATVNNNTRMGFNGPQERNNETKYPPAKFRIVDCTDVLDYLLISPFDSSHQYYRRSLTVRRDILGCMTGNPTPDGGVIVLSANVPPSHGDAIG